MKYKVLRSDIAENQLTEIPRYITNLTGDIQSALEFLDAIDKAKLQLEDFPESGIIPRDLAIRRCGYRFLIVQNYYLFYKINHNEKKVIIYTIIYCKTDYERFL